MIKFVRALVIAASWFLLSGAEEDLSRDRLTSPSGANAWEKYQAVLALEPGHKIASAGLDSIIGRYVSKFDASLLGKDFSEAAGYVSRIQSVYADAPVLSDLSDRLSVAREAERQHQADEAERARLAAEAERLRQVAAEAERIRQSKITGYSGKFEEALSDRDYDTAERYVDSLRVVNVEGSVLSRLEGRLSTAREADSHRVGRRFRDCSECPEMVVVPSGSFRMGSPSGEEGRDNDEGPRHLVTIDYRFAVGVYEVTFSEWSGCVNSGGCGGYVPSDRGWGRGNRPVINVSWEDAQSYVRWLSQKTGHTYGLLSESEWEYVARAGTDTPFYFGSTISTAQANYDGNYTYGGGRKGVYREETVPVGSFSANGWGVYDMHGNVWEWVEDCWNASYVGAPSDGRAWGSGDCGGRVLRGGSWDFDPRLLRSAFRYWNTTGFRYYLFGFRVVRRF